MSPAKHTQVSLRLQGSEHDFGMEPEVETVLQAGLDQGIDLPYSCMGGACATCRAKLVEGEVEMDCNLVLSDEELADDYILACQARPIGGKVTLDFDQ